MKTLLLLPLLALSLAPRAALAEPVRDWRDLEKIHKHVQESIHEMERARAANHYDMDGHGAKAEALLHDVERELHEAIDSARRAR
jgi:hypothetical protein